MPKKALLAVVMTRQGMLVGDSQQVLSVVQLCEASPAANPCDEGGINTALCVDACLH